MVRGIGDRPEHMQRWHFAQAACLRPYRCILLPGRTGSSFRHPECPLVPGSDTRHCSIFPLSQSLSHSVGLRVGRRASRKPSPWSSILLVSPVLFYPSACSPVPGFSQEGQGDVKARRRGALGISGMPQVPTCSDGFEN